MTDTSLTTTCCIAGGGPAGMMLGFLLARAGVDVVVLEKHADFFRDFRGDTVHPSTLELMYELGLLQAFLKVPHQKIERLSAQIGDERVPMADFTHLPTHCKFVALMPQWDFLNFLAERGKRYKSFHLHMNTEATDLIEEGGRVVGLRAKTPDGTLSIRAALTVGCDGRHSTVRDKAGFVSDDYGAPMDVLWFRITRKATDDGETFGHIEAGKMMVMLDRGDYWQCAFVIPKGGIEQVKARGPRSLSSRRGLDVAVSCRPGRRAEKLRRHQASHGDGRSASEMVAAGIDLHRRFCARDVADRRRRRERRRPGRGGCRQPARRAAQGRAGERCRS